MRRRSFISAGVWLLLPAGAGAAAFDYPAPRPDAAGQAPLLVYSTLDAPLAGPLIAGFQAANPTVAIRYEELLASDISARVIAETDAGGTTADLVFSSGMDLQVKLANDGYARPVALPQARDWPRWANWRDTAFALTAEPGVLVYHRPSFPDGPPRSRLELLDWLRRLPPGAGPRVGTYDVVRSTVGYLYLARDAEHFSDIWSLVAAMAGAGLQTFPTSQDIIDRVADGRLAIGYNILGSYAAEQARRRPDLGVILLRDYTVVTSRVALVPRQAGNPEAGARLLAYLMGAEGQRLFAERLGLAAVNPQVATPATLGAMAAAPAETLRPVPVSPGLLAYADQAKRRRLLKLWAAALRGDARSSGN